MAADSPPPALEHYLRTGCRWEADLDVFLLGSEVLRNQLDRLEHVWRDLGAAIKAPHDGELFAEMVLRVGDWRRWPDIQRCREHRSE